MSGKIVVGNNSKGLQTDRQAFNIDNESFPVLVNAYQWRGRIKRKRGTSLLGRLQRVVGMTDGSGNATITLINIPSPPSIISGISQFIIGTDSFIDQGGPNPVTLTTNSVGMGMLNRTTTVLTITGSQPSTPIIYYPDLPVMGLRDLNLTATQYPGTLGFDTTYSYNILTSFPYNIYDVSFYKDPVVSAYLPGYIRKSIQTPLIWDGNNYQQFWTINYQGALWATNGISVPFDPTIVSMQFKPIVAVTVTSGGPPAIVNLQIIGHGLFVGDFLFINEVVSTTGINFQTGYVTVVVDSNNVTVEFPYATIATNGTGGIAQYLTNNAIPGTNPIRWYDGDPTPPMSPNGWVNFSPPLSQNVYNIGSAPEQQWYLAGAVTIANFKDRLLFFGPVIQNSSNQKIYLQDTIIFSQNGTPYYTVSYTNFPNPAVDTPTNPDIDFNAILVPVNQTATAPSWFEDSFGFGYFYETGVAQPIVSIAPNEDVIIIGYSTRQVRLVETGNDDDPFKGFTINSEYGDNSTFGSIILDRGKFSVGNRGIILTEQVSAYRKDLQIPAQIFQFNALNHGIQRICSQRDFINEWMYFTYSSNQTTSYLYPTQTLQYNYQDETWAIFNESYTTYGQFYPVSGFTWATVGSKFPTWADWNEPWGSGSSNALQPYVIGGNQQGFIMQRGIGTNEATSLYIQAFTSNVITSPDHCLNTGDYIIITGCIGTVGAIVNGKIFQIGPSTPNTFTIDAMIGAATYFGGGLIKRGYVPNILTKQFPVAWDMSRKTRIGTQQYLFTTTDLGQIELQIYLSQNQGSPFNFGPVIPATNSVNNSLIYSDTLFTCKESENIGLTPANINLEQLVPAQQQTWHRMNTSLIGDTVQIGFTMSQDQMLSIVPFGSPVAISGATNAYPCVLTCKGEYSENQLISITDIVGMTQLNFNPDISNYYAVISSTSTTVTINVDSTLFGVYIGGGFATLQGFPNQFSEIELHGFNLNVSPSQMLA